MRNTSHKQEIGVKLLIALHQESCEHKRLANTRSGGLVCRDCEREW